MSELDKLLPRLEALLDRLEPWLPNPPLPPDWERTIAFRWRRQGLQGHLHAVIQTSPVRLADLHCIDLQKQQIVRNTRQFLAGLPANNVLLWGPRGTGKSTLIKALLNEYADQGLRIIEVERQHLVDLPDIVTLLRHRKERFIVFCDDLSFEANDDSYKALKVVLDGSIANTPDNILVYATSNRRHLLPEKLSDNQEYQHVEGEIHPGETTEERLSLSERFGLWLAFHPFNQDAYLSIVFYWLKQFHVGAVDAAAVREEALRWALLHGTRSGRSAWQFARDYAGALGLTKTIT